MKIFKFSLVLGTHENTDVFITLENIYGIHSKRANILFVYIYVSWSKVLSKPFTLEIRKLQWFEYFQSSCHGYRHILGFVTS